MILLQESGILYFGVPSEITSTYRWIPFLNCLPIPFMKSGSVHVCHGIKIQKQKTSDAERELMARFYLNHLDYVNNWDLVDSAPHVLGASSV